MVTSPPDESDARSKIRQLVHPSQERFHFSKETDANRLRAVRALAELPLPAIVAVRTAELHPERARGQCWTALLWHLHGLVDGFVIESRTPREDTHDAQIIVGQRPRCCGPMTYKFAAAPDDELLWAADAAAGAVFQARARGRSDYVNALATGPLQVIDL